MRTKEEVIAEVEHLTQIHSTIKEVDNKFFKVLIAEAKQFHLWSELVNIYCDLINIYVNNKSDFEQPKLIFKSVEKVAKKGVNEEVLARFYSVYANYFRIQNDLPTAIQYLKISLGIISKVNSVKANKSSIKLEYTIYYLMAIIFDQLSELAKYKYYLLKSEKLAIKIGDQNLIANCLIRKGAYYYKLKRNEIAEENLEKAIYLLNNTNNKYLIGNALMHLGNINYDRQNFEVSLKYFIESYNLIRSQFPNLKFCSELCKIAENYLILNRIVEAKYYFDLAYEESSDILNKDIKIVVLQSLCRFYLQIKDYEKVIFFRDKIDVIKDKIEESSRLKRIYEIEEKYESTLKQREINYRKKKQRDTNRYLKLMQQKNEDLQQFSYALAHDLREPIRSTKNFINVVAKKVNNPELDIYMNVVNGNLDRMYQLVDDILSLTKLDFDEVHIEEVDMNEIMEEIKDQLAMQIEEKSATIVYHPLPKVTGNKNYLLQLFQNLISNGMKYNRNQPMIEIMYDATIRGKGAFVVKDNGIGIPTDKQAQVFGLFKRAHGKEFQGTGVGLAICKKIVEKMKGEIWLESTEGKGSTFYMRLEAQ